MAQVIPGLLLPPAWLKERLGSQRLRLVDLRDAGSYAEGHIPGATNVQLAALGSTIAGLENVLLPPGEFGALMASHGVSNEDVVVAYDDQWGLAASRLVWALHYYGHDRAAVLDGGWDRWLDEDGPVEVDPGQIDPGAFEAARRSNVRADLYADHDWIARRIGSDGVVFLDTRTPAEFDRGHLPGALSWDWFNAVPAGSWNASRDPAELRAEWRDLGIDQSDDVTVYCRSGMRAAHTWLVLRAAGFERVRLYDGSWQEWSLKEQEESNG